MTAGFYFLATIFRGAKVKGFSLGFAEVALGPPLSFAP